MIKKSTSKEKKKGRSPMEKRMENQRGELEKLRQELARTRVGAAQLQTAVDGLLTAVVLAFGSENEGGEKELKLPGFSAPELKGRYLLQARRAGEGRGYVLTALPRKKEAEEKGGTGGERDRKSEQ